MPNKTYADILGEKSNIDIEDNKIENKTEKKDEK